MNLTNPTPVPQVKNASKRRGVVLIAVLVVITLLSLAGYQYSELMLAEYKVSGNAHRSVQARMLAESGVHYAAAMLSNPDNFQNALGGNPFNHPSLGNVAVGGDGVKGYFSLVAPADATNSAAGFVNGVVDEGGKINLNAMMKLDPAGDLLHAMLIKLPNMTEEIANAIIDWLDPDSDVRPGGAESDYYQSLTPAYRCKNGPIDSINELLLIKGVTRDLLYGTDWNRNGMQDANENSSAGFDRGWSAFLTVHSREQNSDTTGKPFIYLMNPDIGQLYDALTQAQIDDDMIKFIIMYRQYGGTGKSSGQSQSLGSSIAAAFGLSSQSSSSSNTTTIPGDLSSFTLDPKKGGSKGKIQSVFDLVNTYVSISSTDPQTKQKTTTVYASPLNDSGAQRDLMPKLFAVVTMTDPSQQSEIPPRININTAPIEVIAAIPELSDVEVEKIASIRPSLTSGELLGDPIYQSPAWLLTEAQVDVSTLQKLEPYITTRTQVFRVQSIGYFEGKGPAVRVEAIVDTNSGRPRIVAWRNMTDLGKGWNLDMNP